LYILVQLPRKGDRISKVGEPPYPVVSEGAVKRQLEEEQSDNTSSGQSGTADPSTMANEEQIEEDNLHQPASKRIKLNQSEQSLRVDARDKVKGIALIKRE
jgi:tRNA-dihydrouridine synthase 3